MAELYALKEGAAPELIYFDAILREDGDDSAIPTNFPVSARAVRSDHVQQMPAIITIEVLVTDRPLVEPKGIPAGSRFRATKLDFGGGKSMDVTGPSAPLTRVKDVYNRLVTLQRESAIFRLVTSLRDYGSVVLISVPAPREAVYGSSMVMALTFQEFRVANLQSTTVRAFPPAALAARDRNKPEEQKGRKGKRKPNKGEIPASFELNAFRSESFI